MPARSVQVTFQNQTDSALVLTSTDLPHGEWTVSPPARIEPDQTANFSSESDGVATGTEGRATYQLENLAATVQLHWDNPFVGGNSYDAKVSDPIWHRVVSSGSGSGNNSSMTWTLQETSTQRDGIPDDWKKNGAWIDDGTGTKVFVDLPKMGARVDHTDIFVHVDWMQDATHSHALSATAIKQVVDAFKNAPYTSHAGAKGIRLHVDAGPSSIMNHETGQTWGSLSVAKAITEVTNFGTTDAAGNYVWTAFDAQKNAAGGFTRTGRSGIFHYCISMHQFSTFPNSGLARPAAHGPGGNDFIVSLAPISATPSDMNQAGTFMHELGHNLGLGHGGTDSINNKPNYISIMNYLFQLNGLTKNGVPGLCDYSNIALPDLDESTLNEAVGLGPGATDVGTFRWSAGVGGFVAIPDGSQAIDWDDDGALESVNTTYDVNGDGSTGTSAALLKGCNDWTTVKPKSAAIGGGSGAAGGEHVKTSPVEEITKHQQDLIQPLDTTPPVTAAVLDPPPNAAGWNRGPVKVTLNATDDISGAITTAYKVDSDPDWTASSSGTSFVVDGEGTHTISFYSTDRAQNVEPVQSITINIDLTPPEAIISYDPATHQIIVRGTDDLSGAAYSGAVAPSTAVPAIWRARGADAAEARTYNVLDRAGNALCLELQVRDLENEYELNVMSLSYDPPQRMLRDTGGLQKNTIQFRRLMPGRCCCDGVKSGGDGGCACGREQKCVLAVLQRIVVALPMDPKRKAMGPARMMLQAEWDILHDETRVKVGTPTDGNGSRADGDDNNGGKGGDKGGRERETRMRCAKGCGLSLLRIKTLRGRITADTTGIQKTVSGETATETRDVSAIILGE
ncbi:hypothetical protein EDB81DRAFT_818102 [Dactylonectria macrodidyma]|uniref:Uncharacterized protein n=1 Tax=Dactylonectria macrodidyma TaxID=307937 RepID=A0A9P9IEY8_9HYPO|nr:hypothetical protein EDB81DRAFT_818102 [Dactylonectria macrodidyma]